MTKEEAFAVCKEMHDGNEHGLMPWTSEKYAEAIDVLFDLAEERQD